ncbi:MAG TPA: hypothetical protein VGL75_04425 [Acidothermaceae bacterium]|jgi:hypothetical protein
MTIGPLPYQLPTSSGWTYLQTTHDTLQTDPVADASGAAQTQVGEVPAGERWLITRVNISATTQIQQDSGPAVVLPVAATFTAYYTTIAQNTIADATPAGDGDNGDENQPIELNAGDVLLLVWSGMPENAVGWANVTRQVFRQIQGGN